MLKCCILHSSETHPSAWTPTPASTRCARGLQRALPVPMEGDRPGICRCEFSSLLPRHLAIADVAAGERQPGAHAHRDGRAAAAGGLPALRRGCRLAHRCGRARAEVLAESPTQGFLAALRSRHAHLSSGALRRDRAGAVSAKPAPRSSAGSWPAPTACCRATTRRLLARELNLFPDWYIAKHLGIALNDAQSATLASAFRADPRQQSRPAVCIRASRLSFAQSDGLRTQSRRPRFSGCGVRADHV